MAVSPDTEDRLNVQTVEHGGLTWLNVESPGVVEMRFLKERFSFHQLLSLDDCLRDASVSGGVQAPSVAVMKRSLPFADVG